MTTMIEMESEMRYIIANKDTGEVIFKGDSLKGADLRYADLHGADLKGVDLEDIKLFSNGVIFPHRRTEDTIKALSLLRNKGYHVSLDYVGASSEFPSYFRKLKRLVKKLFLDDYVRFHNAVSEEVLLNF